MFMIRLVLVPIHMSHEIMGQFLFSKIAILNIFKLSETSIGGTSKYGKFETVPSCEGL